MTLTNNDLYSSKSQWCQNFNCNLWWQWQQWRIQNDTVNVHHNLYHQQITLSDTDMHILWSDSKFWTPPQYSTTGFVQKNPFRIHKLFTNRCDMAWKSNMKVRNSSTHLVKGCNPYWSWWPTLYQSKLIGSAFFLTLHSHFLFCLNCC